MRVSRNDDMGKPSEFDVDAEHHGGCHFPGRLHVFLVAADTVLVALAGQIEHVQAHCHRGREVPGQFQIETVQRLLVAVAIELLLVAVVGVAVVPQLAGTAPGQGAVQRPAGVIQGQIP